MPKDTPKKRMADFKNLIEGKGSTEAWLARQIMHFDLDINDQGWHTDFVRVAPDVEFER